MPVATAQLTDFVPSTAPAVTRRSPGLVARLARAIHDGQVRRAEREIAHFIEGRGGRLTDALERQIQHHFV